LNPIEVTIDNDNKKEIQKINTEKEEEKKDSYNEQEAQIKNQEDYEENEVDESSIVGPAKLLVGYGKSDEDPSKN
jgi:hypothetical protein